MQQHSEIIKFSSKNVIDFAALTGDTNPIHIDDEFAKTSIFKKRIVHGMYVGSIFSKIIGTTFPGEGSIYLYQELKFLAPIFLDKEYLVIVKAVSVLKDKNRIFLETNVYDNDFKTLCLEGKATVKNTNWVTKNSDTFNV